MDNIYKTRKGQQCFSRVPMPKKNGEFLYFIQIGEVRDGLRLVKIGTTNNVRRRMGEELRQYDENITVLWVSPPYAKYTTRRIEDMMKEDWRKREGFVYIPNDRFLIPASVKTIDITVRNTFTITI